MSAEQSECLVCVFNEVNDTTASLIRKSQHLASMQNIPLKLLWVISDKLFSFELLETPELKAEERVQREFSDFAAKNGFGDIGNCDIRFGKPFVEIILYQQAVNAKLVVKQMEEKSWLSGSIASDDFKLLRKCPTSVLLTRSESDALPKNILVAVDFDRDDSASHADQLNKKMLDTVVRFFDNPETHCTLFNAFNAPQAGFVSLFADHPDKMVDDLLASEKRFKGGELNLLSHYFSKELQPKHLLSNFQKLLVQGDAEHLIPLQVEKAEADLLVIGSVARTGIQGFLMGNTAEEVLSNVNCDVLTLKPDGFVSPVLEAD
ncbi:universal stress protein [Alteromonas gracilis]|uniref:universal stress protein n=1 Tax=Alteromonas gracilis TaxID=1479524 RepID=UPI003734F7C3